MYVLIWTWMVYRYKINLLNVEQALIINVSNSISLINRFAWTLNKLYSLELRDASRSSMIYSITDLQK